MSREEIWYRAKEALRIQADRVRHWFSFELERDNEFNLLLQANQGSFKSYLEQVAAPRFYSSLVPKNRDSTADLIRLSLPENVEQGIAKAETLLSHRLNLLGYRDVVLDKDIDWHFDPVSGYRWPKRFWADYDLVRDRSSDPKVIHELNRQQHLPRLAKAYLLTRDEKFAREAVLQIETWIDQNSVGCGVNWQSSLEIGIRSISWLWTIFMLLPSKSLDERSIRRICKFLFLQIDHVCRYPSIYSSPNTHLIGEATALFIMGLIFQEIPRAAEWREKGRAILIKEMERQVLQDGVYFELSSYYHCYATDFFLQAMLLARLHREPLPEWMWKRLNQMFEFVVHLSRPDGTIPLLGDDDGGRALALAAEHYGSYRDGVSSAAVLFGRPDFKFVAGDIAEESVWLLGADALAVFKSLPAQPSNRLRHFCTESGYFIQRTGWAMKDSHLVFDCGSLGTESGGHGHADALSITLTSAGTELLIDPATAIYHCARDWRNYFRATRAHNTVVVDGLDQSTPGGTFDWDSKASTRLLKQFVMAGVEYIDAEHDGYARLAQPIIHRRRLLHVRPNYWVVLDDLRGDGEHLFDFMYHFASGTKLFVVGDEDKGEIDCRARLNQSSLQISLYSTASMHAEALCGQISPIQGWSSSRYSERRPAPVFKGSVRSVAPVGAMAFLIPQKHAGAGSGEGSVKTRRLNVAGGQALAAVVRDGEFEDLCVLAIDTTAKLRVMDFTMTGEFFWLRLENGTLRQLLAVNASSFSSAGEVIIDESRKISHVMAHLWENGMVIEHGAEEGKVYVRDLRNRQFQRN